MSEPIYENFQSNEASWQTVKLHLIRYFHKLDQIYFKVLLKTPSTNKDVGPPLAPATDQNKKRVL